MDFQFENFLTFVADYASAFPSEMLAGNVFAVAIGLIIVYITVSIINKLTGLLIFLFKKIILAIIIILAFYQFLLHLNSRILAEGITAEIIILGTLGSLVGILALLMALYAAFLSAKKVRGGIYEEKKEHAEREEPEEEKEEQEKIDKRGFRDMLSIQSIKDDKTLGAVIAYLVVAQFGVFSSKTIAAPTADVGIVFLSAFLIAALFFIKQSYKHYSKGLFHLAVALLVGGTLSIILGYLWGGVPLEQLLSVKYFETDSLVALITGLALSLFMGSKA